MQAINPEFSFEDDRGKLYQLASSGWKQINVIYTKKGVIRGEHYHKTNKEFFFVISGKCILQILDIRTKKTEEKMLLPSDMVIVNPYERHAFLYPEDTILVSGYDTGYELPDGTKDVFNDEGDIR